MQKHSTPSFRRRRALPVESVGTSVELKQKATHRDASVARRISAGGVTCERVDIDPGSKFEYSWQGTQHYLALHDITLRSGETFTEGAPGVRRNNLRDTLTFVPAGARIWGWSHTTKRPQSFTAIYLDPLNLPDELPNRLDRLQASRLYFSDNPLITTIRKLHSGLRDCTQFDDLYLESLSTSAAFELAALGSADNESAKIRLTAVNLSRIEDYVVANVEHGITLDQLASLAGLSKYYFIRAFRAARGRTPYQYVIEQRIERAKELISNGDIKVSEVAQRVGFKSTSKFIQTFRRILGVTPGQIAGHRKKAPSAKR
jgi:AraC family transcriptional regulator